MFNTTMKRLVQELWCPLPWQIYIYFLSLSPLVLVLLLGEDAHCASPASNDVQDTTLATHNRSTFLFQGLQQHPTSNKGVWENTTKPWEWMTRGCIKNGLDMAKIFEKIGMIDLIIVILNPSRLVLAHDICFSNYSAFNTHSITHKSNKIKMAFTWTGLQK